MLRTVSSTKTIHTRQTTNPSFQSVHDLYALIDTCLVNIICSHMFQVEWNGMENTKRDSTIPKIGCRVKRYLVLPHTRTHKAVYYQIGKSRTNKRKRKRYAIG